MPDDGVSVPSISSAKAKYSGRPGVYSGLDVRFLLPSGTYTIELIAANLNASAVGHGSIVATGVGTADDGSFTVNGGKPELSRQAPDERRLRQGAVVSATVPTILVVEDESSIASFVSLYLRNAGYAVRTAATGADGDQRGGGARPGADRARPDAAGHRRDRGLQAAPRRTRTCRS